MELPVEDNAHPPLKLNKRRLVVNSTDRTSGTSADFVVNLSPALQNIVSSDWVYTSQTGYMLQMDNFTQTGTTTGTGAQYWRFLGENVNNRYSKTTEAFELPGRSYNYLGIHWRNTDGSVPFTPSTFVSSIYDPITSSFLSSTITTKGPFQETKLELEFWEKLN
jgi:hypothetical protein